jgi:hypothetical protein
VGPVPASVDFADERALPYSAIAARGFRLTLLLSHMHSRFLNTRRSIPVAGRTVAGTTADNLRCENRAYTLKNLGRNC